MRVVLSSAIVIALATPAFAAAVVSQAGSGVSAYFGSQSSAFEKSDPTAPTWSAPGPGPGVAGSPLPGVPAPPVSLVYPTLPGNNFQPSPYTSGFIDGLSTVNQMTTGLVTTADTYLPSASLTSDMAITIPSWTLNQLSAAPGYAYEQLNFVDDYTLTTNTGLGGSTPNLPLFVSGTVAGGSGTFAQIDAKFTYSFQGVNAAGVITGPLINLGTLSYSYLQSSGGPFSASLISTGSLAAVPASDGILEITGYAWVKGDPFTINISSIPEPGSLVLLVPVIGMLRRRWGKPRS